MYTHPRQPKGPPLKQREVGTGQSGGLPAGLGQAPYRTLAETTLDGGPAPAALVATTPNL